MTKDEIDSRTFADDGLSEGICAGWGHEPCNAGTDFRKAWIYEKYYMLRRADAEISRIIFATNNRIPTTRSPDECPSKLCGGCVDFPQKISFDSTKIFSFYCPEYDTDNLCSFRAISYYCDSLRAFLLRLKLEKIDFAFLMEIEGICQEIYKKTFMLAGAHNKAVAVKAQYIKGPGSASKERGEWALDAVKNVLKDENLDYSEYKKLKRGEKKKIVEKIAVKISAKDVRNVYILLKKLKS